ncbi:hypothetical protein Pmani_039536, partial [Petrolisthes manimaculis]
NLSQNELGHVTAGVFTGLSSLLSLDLRGNGFTVLGSRVFSGLTSLDHLWTDEFRFCCLAGTWSIATRHQTSSVPVKTL